MGAKKSLPSNYGIAIDPKTHSFSSFPQLVLVPHKFLNASMSIIYSAICHNGGDFHKESLHFFFLSIS